MRKGAVVEYVPDALVVHHVFPLEWAELISRTARVAGFPALFREVPELRRRRLCRYRVQLGPRTRAPVYLLAVSVPARQRRLAAALAIWWMWLRWRDLGATGAPWRRKLAMLPAEMVIDSAFSVGLLVGSARARTLLL
jgi:hypothetical protein